MTEDQLHYKEIACIEKIENYTFIILADGKEVIIEKTLIELEKLLPMNEFLRVHRGYIVKLTEIIEIIVKGNSCFLQLKSGKLIPLARRRKNSLLVMLNIIY